MQFIDPKGSFLKNLVLSLLLLGVSSLLIPVVLRQIDEGKSVEQLELQEQLSRQDTILSAQAALLDTMATDFWGYESYASDVVISRDTRFGQDDWHTRAVDAYYQNSGQLLGKMRAEISTLLRLAPDATYESFLRFYEEDILLLDACLLELLKLEQNQTPMRTDGVVEPARCSEGDGMFAGATWEDLADFVAQDTLAERMDREFAALAQTFRLEGVSNDAALPRDTLTPAPDPRSGSPASALGEGRTSLVMRQKLLDGHAIHQLIEVLAAGVDRAPDTPFEGKAQPLVERD